MPFKTQTGETFCVSEDPITQAQALNNAFRHYKQFYFSTLRENLPVVQNPGLDELARCTFNHPIEDEAAGELAQLLGQETPITYRPKLPPEARNTLVQSYRSHHVYLRAVKKFYQSKFLRKNAVYNECMHSPNHIDLQKGLPLPQALQAEYKKANQDAPTQNRIVPTEQSCSLHWQMESPYDDYLSHWPPTVFDLCYFLERARLSTPDLELPGFARNTRRWTESVAQEVGLSETLSNKKKQNAYDWWEIAHWSTSDQENLTEPIRQKYLALEEEQQSRDLERVASSPLQRLTLYDDSLAEGQVSPRDNFQGIPPPGASISIAVNNGAFWNASLWVASLFLFGLLYHKISEFLSSKNPQTQKIVLENALNPKISSEMRNGFCEA